MAVRALAMNAKRDGIAFRTASQPANCSSISVVGDLKPARVISSRFAYRFPFSVLDSVFEFPECQASRNPLPYEVLPRIAFLLFQFADLGNEVEWR